MATDDRLARSGHRKDARLGDLLALEGVVDGETEDDGKATGEDALQSEQLLRQWKQETWLKQMNDDWAKDKEWQKMRLEGIKQMLGKEQEKMPQ